MHSIRRLVGNRSRPSDFWGYCCCRRSTRSARNSGWSSGSNSICCSAGSSASRCDDPVWNTSTFTRNRDRLWVGQLVSKLLGSGTGVGEGEGNCRRANISRWMTRLETWGNTKRFRPKDGSGPPPDVSRNGVQDSHGQNRSNETHAPTTNSESTSKRRSAGPKRWPDCARCAVAGCRRLIGGHTFPRPPTPSSVRQVADGGCLMSEVGPKQRAETKKAPTATTAGLSNSQETFPADQEQPPTALLFSNGLAPLSSHSGVEIFLPDLQIGDRSYSHPTRWKDATNCIHRCAVADETDFRGRQPLRLLC